MEEGSRGWDELLEEVTAKLRQWRAEHPRATFVEIERTMDGELARLRARMLEDLIHESASAEWSGRSKAERPKCPVCGRPLQANGPRERTLVTVHEQSIKLKRTHGRCPACQATVFPPG